MTDLKWVDIMKGIGILLVVIGHLSEGILGRLIFLIHMPLFFFLSGYLFVPNSNYFEYFKYKTIHLLIPYFIFLIPLYLFFSQFPLSTYSIQDYYIYFLKIIIGGRALGGTVGIFWFVSCLFFTQQIMNIFLLKFTKNRIESILLFMLGFAYINSIYFSEIWLPWNVNVILMSLPIFYIGYKFKIVNYCINSYLLLTQIIH